MSNNDIGQLALVNFFTQSWTIENFRSYCKKVDPKVRIRSPKFILNPNLTMYLLLEIHNDTDNSDGKTNAGDISVFLNLEELEDPVTVEYELCLLDSNGEKKKLSETMFFTFTSDDLGYGAAPLVNKNIVTDRSQNLLLDDKLTILCRMKVFDKTINEPSLPLNIYSGFEKLLKNQDFCDATLDVSGKELKVHKAILAAKSPVFYAMFSNNTKEANENLVKIDDVTFDVMKDVVQFMYTGFIKNFENHAHEVLIVADKYCIDDLKLFCCRYIQEQLNVENAVKLLIVSDQCNAVILDFIKEFITNNIKQVSKTKGFEEAKKTHPNLLLEIFCESIKNSE